MPSLTNTERRYIGVHASITLEAEYLQSYDSSVRKSLPDTYVAALIAAIFVSLGNGFFSRIGEAYADLAIEKIRRIVGNEEADEVAVAIETLTIIEPHLDDMRASTASERAEELSWIEGELEARGFPEEVAKVIAERVLSELLKESN